MNVFDLEAKIGLDSEPLERGLKAAGKTVADFSKSIDPDLEQEISLISDDFTKGIVNAGKTVAEFSKTAESDLQTAIGLDTNAFDKGMANAERTMNKHRSDVVKLGQTYETESSRMSSSMERAQSDIDESQTEIANTSKTQASKFSENWENAVKGVEASSEKLKDLLGTVGKITAAATGAAAAGITAVLKQSVSAYSDYEQLVGGTELMFGEAFDFVVDRASNAYKTVQMSQNDYLQQVNGFATGLKSALGGNEQAAAELADRIITAEADIVAATGQSQEAVQNAFNGIMRNNFTMLDNLMIGLPTTKEGFQEIIDKVNEWNSANGKAVDYMIDNLADCESALVDYIEMLGYSDYAADEAAKTIAGSIASAKGAWENLTVEFAKDNGDIQGSFETLFGEIENLGDILLPRVEQTLNGVGTLITTASPKISSAISSLIPKIMPTVIKSAGSLVGAIGTAIINSAPELLEAGVSILEEIETALTETDFDGGGVIRNISSAISDKIPEAFKIGENIISTVANNLLNVDFSAIGTSFSTVVSSAIGNFSELLKDIDWKQAGKDIGDFISSVDWADILTNVASAIGAALKAVPDLLKGIMENLDFESAASFVGLLLAKNTLSHAFSALKNDPTCIGHFKDIKTTLTTEIGGSGETAGVSWSQAFCSAIKSFGIGWTIGTYLRNEVFGAENVDEWVWGQMDKSLAGAIARASDSWRDSPEDIAYVEKNGQQVPIYKYDLEGNITGAWKTYFPNARGSIISKPTHILAGEDGTEAIVPLENHTEWIDKVADRLGERSSGQSFNNPIFNININGEFDMTDPLERRRIAEEISRELRELQISEVRGQGGVAW